MMKESLGDKMFRGIITVLLIILALIAVLPLISTIAMSFSSSFAADMNSVTLWPVDFTLASWEYVLTSTSLWRSCVVTACATILVVILSLLVTSLMAYPLSKSCFKAGKILMIFVILTMIFKAPTVPYFLTIKAIGLYDNPLILVFPHVFSAYNMAIMRTSFKAFPSEIEEAAEIDGCGKGQILFRIILPSSKATLATIGLFYGVVAWNQFRNPLMFIYDTDWYPLQLKIRQLINGGAEVVMDFTQTIEKYNETTTSAATMIFAILPVIAVYPWLQKYFAKGAMLGSVKG